MREALDLLSVHRLLLGIHDPAFPSRPDEDTGRGSPYSDGARDFLEFVQELGFDGVQLGPQGITSAVNPSPYDGTLFSKNPLSVALGPLTGEEWGGLLAPGALAALVAERPGPPDRVPYPHVYETQRRVLEDAYRAFRRRADAGEGGVIERLSRGLEAFRAASAEWLERDALYEVLQRIHGGRDWREWRGGDGGPHPDQHLWDPQEGAEGNARATRREVLTRHAGEVEAFAFGQFLVHEQHRRWRQRMARLGLAVFGDLQVGLSSRDAWYARGFLLSRYVMGAPPSRTNPEGQPWNYPVLDPERTVEATPDGSRREGPAQRFLRTRVAKMFEEFEGIRIDHPHGLVCPWVYRAGQPDPLRAVQAGARLHDSPDLPDHPELARYAIARPDQLDRARPRHDDGWVRELDEGQVERYAALVGVIVDEARAHGLGGHAIACEVLSTQPYPLRRVVARYGLGRFRVTQKADLQRTDDVYRGENARTEDWIMLGNHDTRPIWLVAEEWRVSGASRRQAEYLASRLLAPEEDRGAWVERTAGDLGELVQARFADLFVGPARNVQVFFTDFLGLRSVYNRPGTVDLENWSLRILPSFREDYAARRREGSALDLPRALARAMRGRGASFAAAHRTLLESLERSRGG